MEVLTAARGQPQLEETGQPVHLSEDGPTEVKTQLSGFLAKKGVSPWLGAWEVP